MCAYRILFITNFILFSVLFSGCGKNPVSPEPEPDGFSRIIGYVFDDEGKPFEGISLFLRYQTESGSWKQKDNKYIDENGQAVFDSLAAGTYDLRLGSHPTRHEETRGIFQFNTYVVLEENETKEVTFRYPAKVTLDIFVVAGPDSEPMEGLYIYIRFEPSVAWERTDEEGHAVIKDIPTSGYNGSIVLHNGSFYFYHNQDRTIYDIEKTESAFISIINQ